MRKKQVNFSAGIDLVEEIKKAAKMMDIPSAQFIRQAIREKLARVNKTKKHEQ